MVVVVDEVLDDVLDEEELDEPPFDSADVPQMRISATFASALFALVMTIELDVPFRAVNANWPAGAIAALAVSVSVETVSCPDAEPNAGDTTTTPRRFTAPPRLMRAVAVPVNPGDHTEKPQGCTKGSWSAFA
jgi:hypothetical protein